MEYFEVIFCGIHIKNCCLLVIKIESIPSVPALSENFGRGRKSVQTVILVRQDRTAHLEREYVQLIGAGSVATFAGGP